LLGMQFRRFGVVMNCVLTVSVSEEGVVRGLIVLLGLVVFRCLIPRPPLEYLDAGTHSANPPCQFKRLLRRTSHRNPGPSLPLIPRPRYSIASKISSSITVANVVA